VRDRRDFFTREQCRAGRSLIGWSRKDLASASSIALRTIVDFERGARSTRSATLSALKSALESADVRFIAKGGVGVGVERASGSPQSARLTPELSSTPESTKTVDFSPAQCRAARALLDWTQPRLAEASTLSLSTIVDFERDRRAVSQQAVGAMRVALEAAGVQFIAENGGGVGVKLRSSRL
jgi:transcriptional regulator with XRE-family HTH domain